MKWIKKWTMDYEIEWRYDPHNYERNFSNCVEKPVKFRASMVLNLLPSQNQITAINFEFAFLPLLSLLSTSATRTFFFYPNTLSGLQSSLLLDEPSHWDDKWPPSEQNFWDLLLLFLLSHYIVTGHVSNASKSSASKLIYCIHGNSCSMTWR